jgi:hypothetical protein
VDLRVARIPSFTAVARAVLLIRGAMGLPRSRKRWVVGAVAAAIAVWLGGACLGACDLNPHPLPPNALSGSGDEDDATVAGKGSSSGGGSSGSGSGGAFSTGGDGGIALPAIDAGAAANDGGGEEVSMSPDAGGVASDAAVDAGDAADAADAESDGSDAMSEGPDAEALDGSGD